MCFHSGFREKNTLRNGLGRFLSFLGKFKICANITFIVLCFFVFERFCVLQELGFFHFIPVLNVGNVEYSCSICRVNSRSQLYVLVNVPQTLCFYVCWYFFERAVCGSSHIFIVSCFRIEFKTKRCLNFGNQIFTMRA